MSKGSKIVPVRIPNEMLAELEAAVISQNHYTKGEPLSVSAWIRKCIDTKLRHLGRSRNWKAYKASHEEKVDDAVIGVGHDDSMSGNGGVSDD